MSLTIRRLPGLIGRRKLSFSRYTERKPHIQPYGLRSGWTRTAEERRRRKEKRRAAKVRKGL